MDTTRTKELLTELATADPAQAPDLADELTATLADALDDSKPDEPETPAPAGSDEDTP